MTNPLIIQEANRLYSLAFPTPAIIDREYRRLYYLAFPKKKASLVACAALWSKTNRDKKNASKKQWVSRNRKKVATQSRLWAKNNPEKIYARNARQRAVKRKATCGDKNKIAKIYKRALTLRRWFDVVVDHIIPLSKGGPHSPENLQIIYAKENALKGIRLDYKPRVIFI
jgi:5-methylcytosine-specific restriction endonuclease McrA